jgi:hypothetical protein
MLYLLSNLPLPLIVAGAASGPSHRNIFSSPVKYSVSHYSPIHSPLYVFSLSLSPPPPPPPPGFASLRELPRQ